MIKLYHKLAFVAILAYLLGAITLFFNGKQLLQAFQNTQLVGFIVTIAVLLAVITRLLQEVKDLIDGKGKSNNQPPPP